MFLSFNASKFTLSLNTLKKPPHYTIKIFFFNFINMYCITMMFLCCVWFLFYYFLVTSGAFAIVVYKPTMRLPFFFFVIFISYFLFVVQSVTLCHKVINNNLGVLKFFSHVLLVYQLIFLHSHLNGERMFTFTYTYTITIFNIFILILYVFFLLKFTQS